MALFLQAVWEIEGHLNIPHIFQTQVNKPHLYRNHSEKKLKN